MIYLKNFETTAEYNAYTADTTNFIKPNVSLITETNSITYHPIDPYNGHTYVEIGGLKWATMNIGASSVTDAGLYFQWGDTQCYTADKVGMDEGQKYFGWEDYKWTNDGGSTMTKYNSSDGKTVLEMSDDAARANWGGQWRMPTTAEFQALGEAVNTAWTTDYQGSGVAGLVCTDNTDSSKVLFFPATGFCRYGGVLNVGGGGICRSSSLYSSNVQKDYIFGFGSNYCYWGDNGYRCYGITVRGVVG